MSVQSPYITMSQTVLRTLEHIILFFSFFFYVYLILLHFSFVEVYQLYDYKVETITNTCKYCT